MRKNRMFFESSSALFWIAAAGVCLIFAALPGCGPPTPDLTSQDGKQAILDATDIALTQGNCSAAVAEIEPLYNSQYSDNDVRKKAASAYGCDAGINLFKLIGDLVASSAEMSTGFGFWTAMTRLFPSTTGSDYKVEGAIKATGATQAMLTSGALVLPTYQVNTGTYNVGSVFSGDRIDDANLYLLFVSMAGIGAAQNRNGAPNSTYNKTKVLPWTSATAVDGNGCAYAASIVNFLDTLQATQNIVPANVASTLSTAASPFKALIDAACDYGCKGGFPPHIAGSGLNDNGNWVTSGCSFPAGTCSTCPAELRDPARCTSQITDKASCAAAGVVNFINSSMYGWQ